MGIMSEIFLEMGIMYVSVHFFMSRHRSFLCCFLYVINACRSAISKRYDNSSGYGGASDRNMTGNSVWAPSSSSHMGHSSSSGVPTMKSYVSNGMSTGMHSSSTVWQKSGAIDEPNWRSIQSSQDRYDRTYNERGGNYLESSRSSGGMYGGTGRPAPERYGGAVSSRYDNSKY